jgi:hypothetical protein
MGMKVLSVFERLAFIMGQKDKTVNGEYDTVLNCINSIMILKCQLRWERHVDRTDDKPTKILTFGKMEGRRCHSRPTLRGLDSTEKDIYIQGVSEVMVKNLRMKTTH